MGLQLAGANLTLPLKTPAIGERLGPLYVWRYDRYWPKAAINLTQREWLQPAETV
jgi:hypothetical protein